MTIITSLIIAFAIMFAPATTPTASPLPSPTASPLEDEAGWDCNIHGNQSCEPTEEAEAWTSYDALNLTPETHDGLIVDYVGKTIGEPHTSTMAATEFAIPSASDPTVWYTFAYVTLTSA